MVYGVHVMNEATQTKLIVEYGSRCICKLIVDDQP